MPSLPHTERMRENRQEAYAPYTRQIRRAALTTFAGLTGRMRPPAAATGGPDRVSSRIQKKRTTEAQRTKRPDTQSKIKNGPGTTPVPDRFAVLLGVFCLCAVCASVVRFNVARAGTNYFLMAAGASALHNRPAMVDKHGTPFRLPMPRGFC